MKNLDTTQSGNVAGVLLYAATDEEFTPNEQVVIGGNPISLRTLDLGTDWDSIRSQLDSIPNWLDNVDPDK